MAKRSPLSRKENKARSPRTLERRKEQNKENMENTIGFPSSLEFPNFLMIDTKILTLCDKVLNLCRENI